MERVAFTFRIRPECVDEYRRRHTAVWPEMISALRAAGWHNYSLFLADGGLVVGYLETENFEAAQAAMAGSNVNQRWQQYMAGLLATVDGVTADTALRRLPVVFHVD